jgi:hypothetical protein
VTRVFQLSQGAPPRGRSTTRRRPPAPH